VLQSPFKANDMYDQDKGQDEAVHLEHGLASASASVGRAVYEVRMMAGCCAGRQAAGRSSDDILIAFQLPFARRIEAIHARCPPNAVMSMCKNMAVLRRSTLAVGPVPLFCCLIMDLPATTLHPDRGCKSHAEDDFGAALPVRTAAQVLRISPQGKQRRIYVKRRDLLRSNGLLPRDLRRIDPTLSVTKTSPAISIKEHVLLVNLGGVRCATLRLDAVSKNACECRRCFCLWLPRTREACSCFAAMTASGAGAHMLLSERLS
jgi:hypothetical protein